MATVILESDVAQRDRKLEHIELALDARTQLQRSSFDGYGFVHEALPEIDLEEIDLQTSFLGKPLRSPLLISCMTGGTGRAREVNRNLALAAERWGIAVGVGSQRKALEEAETASTFAVREAAPTVPVLANLGAVQLNYGYGVEECRRAVEMVGADALVLHLNPLQEAIQPEGQRNFKDLRPRIAQVAAELEVPLAAKEVGCGLSAETARALVDCGVKILDTAGLGGTSWARIEGARAEDADLGELFADWGVPSPESIRAIDALRRDEGWDGLVLIGSGGVRSGLDVAKAIALGADLVGLAQPFLAPALESAERVGETIERILRELRIAMFCVGARNLGELRKARLVKKA